MDAASSDAPSSNVCSVAGVVGSAGIGVRLDGASSVREPPGPGDVGTPVSTGGITSATAVGFSASPRDAARSGAESPAGTEGLPDDPAINPRKKATQSPSRSAAKRPTAWRAVSEIW